MNRACGGSYSVDGGSRNLYYQPEEDISFLNNQSAFGKWTLEVQDDRAGAANGTLLSWQLGFTFANTNFIPTVPIIPGQPLTNVIPPGGVFYFAVNVPANADIGHQPPAVLHRPEEYLV